MKFYILILLLLGFVAPAFAGEPFDVRIVRPSDESLQIQRVTTARTAVGVVVHGRITAARPQYLPAGHVDIATYRADGTLLVETTAMVRPHNLSRQAKRKGGVRFSAELLGVVPAGSTIKLAYHRVGAEQNGVAPTVHKSLL